MPPPRNMSEPVYEEQRFDDLSLYSPECNAALPLRAPSVPAQDQGLQLATNGDVLVGRADNGLIPRFCNDACLAHAPRQCCSDQPVQHGLIQISHFEVLRSQLALVLSVMSARGHLCAAKAQTQPSVFHEEVC